MGIESVVYSREQPATTVNDKNLATYKVKWDVQTDDPEYGPNTLVEDAIAFGGSAPIPRLWEHYRFRGDESLYSHAREFSVKQNRVNLLRWQVDVSYKPLGEGEEEDDTILPPWDRPAKYSVDREVYTRILEQDIHGWQIVNTAGKMYDEPLEQEASRGVVVIQKNVHTLNEVANYIANFSDAVNKWSWHLGGQYIARARTALCRDVTASEIMTEAEYKFYSVTFRIALKANKSGSPMMGSVPSAEETWDRAILERGYQYRGSAERGREWSEWKEQLEGTPAQREYQLSEGRITELEKAPVGAEPVLLDENGFKLPEGEIGIFTFWETRRQVDFNQIPR